MEAIKQALRGTLTAVPWVCVRWDYLVPVASIVLGIGSTILTNWR